jgi:hypothetical protein
MDTIDIGIYIVYLFFGVALVSAVLLPLINAIRNPAGLIKSLIGVGALVVAFIIVYSISGSEVSSKAAAMGVDEGGSKMIGAGLMLFYSAFILAAVGIVFSEINKSLK